MSFANLAPIAPPVAAGPVTGTLRGFNLYPTLLGIDTDVVWRPKALNFKPQQHTSGREVIIQAALYPMHEFELTYNVMEMSTLDFQTMMGFFLAVGGSWLGFAFLNPYDYGVTAQPVINTVSQGSTGDGTTKDFLLVRTYGNVYTGTEPVGLVNSADGAPQAFNVYLNGTLQSSSTYTLEQISTDGDGTGYPGNQILSFATAPASGVSVTVDMSYYYWVRLGADQQDFEQVMWTWWQLKKVLLSSKRST